MESFHLTSESSLLFAKISLCSIKYLVYTWDVMSGIGGLEEELVGCVMGYGFWFGVFGGSVC